MDSSVSSPETTTESTASAVESTPASSTPAESSPAQATETTGADTSAVATAPEVPAYTPNYKYNAAKQEREIPEWARAGIKDAKTEAEAREIFEKAHGLEVVKPKYSELQEQYQQTYQEHTDLMASIDMARNHVAKGDYESFFKQLNLPEEQVLKYFLDKAKLMEAPPEHRQAHQMKLEAERRAQQAETRLSQMESQQREQLKNETLSGLQNEFAKSEVTDFAKQFDTRLGKEGAFFEEVVRRGDFYWKNGQYAHPSQVVAEMMKLGGYTPAAVGTAAVVQPGAGQAPKQVVKPTESIPAISGRSGAPMSQQISSIDELVALRKKKYGS